MIGDCREVRKRLAEKKEKQPGHKSTQQGKNCCFRRTIDARSYTNRRKWGGSGALFVRLQEPDSIVLGFNANLMCQFL